MVGEQKPARSMFETAMKKMCLTEADKPRIVMVGNNLKKDVAGANRFGITSIWFDWSPRYFHNVEEPDWQPDYTVKTTGALKELIDALEKDHESRSALLEKSPSALLKEVDSKLEKVVDAFTPILYEQDDTFMDNMKKHNLAGDDISKYQFWEWTQGVGLYGLWKLFSYQRNKDCYIEILRHYYDRQINIGFPALNVNTAAPYLAMSFLAEYTGRKSIWIPV